MGRLYNTCTTRYGMVKIKFHPAVSPMKRGNPGGKGHINIRQGFGDEALFFVPAFLPADVSKYAKIKNTTLHICVFQKFFVILQAI